MEIQFTPAAELTFDTVQQDAVRLQKLARAQDNATIFCNLTNVNHCDSAGLAFLIEAKRICKTFKKDLRIEGASAAIHALAEFCGVGWILESPVKAVEIKNDKQ
ncbi:anti-anti-sigma factor (plasmid) [Legionella adelaidensis]|uniref:Anti-anti-sigma factor n=1 Tax=Legionella adelaidensis TaxID=45056 RepID=A0A0W0R3T6_9GAMM|nr:STAS domain-containing protein [Legionella adelaidensis]KTC65734.1 putative anti-sigma-B factor antagonist (Anti-anti-sigma-B factor) [Legionella adelaidensis]VEH85100.1 anti-anti-sigma factor [Legionella adelaidensis]